MSSLEINTTYLDIQKLGVPDRKGDVYSKDLVITNPLKMSFEFSHHFLTANRTVYYVSEINVLRTKTCSLTLYSEEQMDPYRIPSFVNGFTDYSWRFQEWKNFPNDAKS